MEEPCLTGRAFHDKKLVVMDRFNPYEQWLTISYDGTVPSYYEMLGISADELDESVIMAAADRALSTVRACRPGKHAALWTDLLDQLTDAKACLTDVGQRAAYDQLLVDGALPHKDLAQPTADMDSLDESPLLPDPLDPFQPEPQDAAPQAPPESDSPEHDPFAPAHLAGAPGQLPEANMPLSPLPVAAEVQPPLSPVPVAAEVRPPLSPVPVAAAVPPPSMANSVSTADMLAANRSDSQRNMVVVVAGSVFLVGMLSLMYYLLVHRGETVANKDQQRTAVRNSAPAETTSSTGPRVTPPVEPRPTPDRPVTMPPQTPTPDPIPTPPTPDPIPTPPPDPPPTPTPTPPAPDAPKPLSDQEKVRLAAAFTMVRTALSEPNFMVAQEQMEVARMLARTPEFEAMYRRLSLLVQYTRVFDQLLKQSLSEMQAGNVIEIGTSTVVAVVEVTDEQITIKVAGVLKKFLLAEMSKGLIMGIAKTKFDMQKPGSVMAVGTYLATCKGSTDEDRQRARELWRQAATMGAKIGDLEKVLDDSYDFAPDPK